MLAVYGDVVTANVRAAVEKAFAHWPAAAESAALAVEPSPLLNSLRRAVETRDKKQAVLVVGYQGTTLQAPDRYALDLLQEVCSDLGSRLFLRIRDELGLAYYVGAQNFVGLAPVYFDF